jgi:DNA repair protein RecO (recombination protein O)
MFTTYRTQAVVLGRKNINEADSLIYFFTREFGLLKVLGKSIRKISSKLKYGVQDFNFCEIEFVRGKKFKILTDIYSIKNFPEIEKDLKKKKLCHFICDSFVEFVKEPEKDPKLWNLLIFSLQMVRDWDKNLFLVYQFFIWNFLKNIGFGIDFEKCFSCHKKLKPQKNFYFLKKGIICDFCNKKIGAGKKIKISRDALKILRTIQKKDLKLLKRLKIEDKKIIKELDLITNYYLKVVQKNDK